MPRSVDTKTATPTRGLLALVMIGRGDKKHPARVTRWDSDPGTPWNREGYTIENLLCSCPNACNGHARHSARVVKVTDTAYSERTCLG